MRKSIFAMGTLFALGMAGLAAAQPYTTFQYWDPADPAKAPVLLSKTGFYTNLAVNKHVIAAAVYFDVNSALWSDGSAKQRWVILKPGKSIGFEELSDYWDYPDSTVFVKNFAIDTVAGDTLSRVLWETRFLILKKEADFDDPTKRVDTWYGFSYKWRADQKEADLVADTGSNDAIKWYPKGRNQPAAMKKWVFPSRSNCTECHVTEGSGANHGRSVLGFFTAQLNMPSPRTPGVNQLEDFFNKAVLKGTKPNFDLSPRWYGIKSTDPKATLENKSRAYIAANCSGCHGDRGLSLGAARGTDLNYDYFKGVPHMAFEYREVGWSYGLDNPAAGEPMDHPIKGVYLVTPGYPEKSVILYRQQSRNLLPFDSATAYSADRNQMPPFASYEVNEEAMAVIGQWIKELPQTGPPISTRPSARQALLSPIIQGRNLVLPPELMNRDMPVTMTSIDGRVQALKPSGRGVYAIPMSLPAGIYILRVGAQRFTRSLF